jgi:enoyl-CoA hydratase
LPVQAIMVAAFKHTGVDMHEVIVEKKDGIGRIIFNRPEMKNALTPQMLDKVMTTIAEFERDDEVRVLLLSGAGG